jgi:hypothetical protein
MLVVSALVGAQTEHSDAPFRQFIVRAQLAMGWDLPQY